MTDLSDMRRYNFKLYPNKTQRDQLEQQAALSGQLWNAALAEREAVYSRLQQYGQAHDGQGNVIEKVPSKFDQSKSITKLRQSDFDYLDMGSDSMALVVHALDDAFKAFFNRAKQGAGASSGYPKYKPTFIGNNNRHGTIWHREHRKGWRLDFVKGKDFRVHAKGIDGRIKARGKFPDGERELRDMRILRKGSKWFISIVVRCDASRIAGECQTEIDMNLIEEFAHVKMSDNGRCATSDDAFFEKQRREFSLISKGNDSISNGAPEIGGESQVRWTSPTCWPPNGDPEIEGKPQGVKASLRQISPNGDPKIETNDRNSHLSNLVKSQKRIDTLLSECDTKHKKFSYRWKQKRKHVARLQSKLARQQQDFLHKWTSWIISQSRSVDMSIPDLEKVIKTGRGNQKFHGAAVKTVASVNRRVLSQCSGYTRQMLEYKGKSADIPVNVEVVKKHITAIGQDISHAVKAERKASRSIKKQEAA